VLHDALGLIFCLSHRFANVNSFKGNVNTAELVKALGVHGENV